MEHPVTERARRIALLIQYDGTAFNGFQYQTIPGTRTIQSELERAVKVLTREESRVIAAGRTDTGVHALGQVVHFDSNTPITLERMQTGLNGILSRDVAVKNVYETDKQFHARYSAVEREYKYYIYNHPNRTPFMLYRAMWVNYKLDVEYLRAASSYLVGEHDFASFCKKVSTVDENTVRRIKDITVTRMDHLLEITITGNAFLHNMIRIIIGTLLEMCRDGENPAKIKQILEGKDRCGSGITAHPYGLYLSKVTYSPDLSSYKAAVHNF